MNMFVLVCTTFQIPPESVRCVFTFHHCQCNRPDLLLACSFAVSHHSAATLKEYINQISLQPTGKNFSSADRRPTTAMYFSQVSRHNNSVLSSAFFAASPEFDEPVFVSLTPASLSRKRLHDEASIVGSTGPSAKRRIIQDPGTRGSGESSYYVIAPKPALPPIPEEPLVTSDAGALGRITALQNFWQQVGTRRNDTNPEQMPLLGTFQGRTGTEEFWTVIAPMVLFPTWHTLLFTVSDPPVDGHCSKLQASKQKLGKQPQHAVENPLRLFFTLLQDVANGVDAGYSQTGYPGIDFSSK